MYITAQIPVHSKPEPLVPAKAVILYKDNFYVFISKGNGLYVRRQIEIGPEDQGMVPVLSGLSVGDKVVSEGTIYLDHLLQSARHQS
jgi:cobalt-zinc-cadmium efflux system membrane fusion protein